MTEDIHSPEFQKQFAADLRAQPWIGLRLDAASILTLIYQLRVALRVPGNVGEAAQGGRRIADLLTTRLATTATLKLGIQAGYNPVTDIEIEEKQG